MKKRVGGRQVFKTSDEYTQWNVFSGSELNCDMYKYHKTFWSNYGHFSVDCLVANIKGWVSF